MTFGREPTTETQNLRTLRVRRPARESGFWVIFMAKIGVRVSRMRAIPRHLGPTYDFPPGRDGKTDDD
jgi:hypothetical protein